MRVFWPCELARVTLLREDPQWFRHGCADWRSIILALGFLLRHLLFISRHFRPPRPLPSVRTQHIAYGDLGLPPNRQGHGSTNSSQLSRMMPPWLSHLPSYNTTTTSRGTGDVEDGLIGINGGLPHYGDVRGSVCLLRSDSRGGGRIEAVNVMEESLRRDTQEGESDRHEARGPISMAENTGAADPTLSPSDELPPQSHQDIQRPPSETGSERRSVRTGKAEAGSLLETRSRSPTPNHSRPP